MTNIQKVRALYDANQPVSIAELKAAIIEALAIESNQRIVDLAVVLRAKPFTDSMRRRFQRILQESDEFTKTAKRYDNEMFSAGDCWSLTSVCKQWNINGFEINSVPRSAPINGIGEVLSDILFYEYIEPAIRKHGENAFNVLREENVRALATSVYQLAQTKYTTKVTQVVAASGVDSKIDKRLYENAYYTVKHTLATTVNYKRKVALYS